MRLLLLAIISCVPFCRLFSTDYYISPSGNDAHNGLEPSTSWATLGKAISMAKAGDDVYILSGTYKPTVQEISRTENNGLYAIVYDMDNKGVQGKPVRFIGVLDEEGHRPVFDFSEVRPEGQRVTAFLISGQYIVLRNIEVTSVQVCIKDHTQSENIRVTNGSHNTFDNVACHSGMGVGFYVTKRSSYNLFLNCDAYANYDYVSEKGKGGNNDGFGCHVASSSNIGNIFIGCRAWYNSDDGYDLIRCSAPVTICYSYAYVNGKSMNADGTLTSRADGNGFKCGGWGMTEGKEGGEPEEGAPMHHIHHNIAVMNTSNGIYSNHNLAGIHFHHNTSYNNGRYNYDMRNRKDGTTDGVEDVNGYGHLIEYNLSMKASKKYGDVGFLDGESGACTIVDNSFTWDSKSRSWINDEPSTSDFISTDHKNLIADRNPDGTFSKATLNFLQKEAMMAYGADFSDYANAIIEVKRTSGAEIPDGTYIHDVVVDKKTGTDDMYNLLGQRIHGNIKGLIVKNGKKVISR